ncbi:hypothetical protein CNMCM5793_006069 [Aspergillus hiratsukae]|uniref:Uncharacterized protein n=1 Tax=Aspergillus hiratsukae TaxID=1194566 RepID=A0A8H6P5I2_9EURO|nr:hypothetical protein CNMCM5793_006069 [Aspergillus hiratsukae]
MISSSIQKRVSHNYPPEHEDDPSHAISLHAHSGFLPVPPPPPPRTQSARSPYCTPPTPPRRRPLSVSHRDSDVPPRKPPRPINPKPSEEGPPPETKSEAEAEAEETVQAIPYASRPVLPSPPLDSTEPSPRPYSSTSWIPLFTEDMKPSASLTRLIEELFSHLDPQRTGYLSPEAISEYIDACGAPPSHNVWKTSRAKNPQYGYDMADRELADHFTAYGVDFALRPRTPPPTPVNSPLDPLSYLPTAQRSAISAFMPAQSTSTPANSLSGGQKPMLSSRGWMDLTICSVLLNPSAACGQLNRAMQAFQLAVWREWGDIPRDMLPLAPYQPEVERVRVLLEGARLNAEQEVDAVHARLKLEQRGRQHALDLLDDRVWVRW